MSCGTCAARARRALAAAARRRAPPRAEHGALHAQEVWKHIDLPERRGERRGVARASAARRGFARALGDRADLVVDLRGARVVERALHALEPSERRVKGGNCVLRSQALESAWSHAGNLSLGLLT